MAEMGRSLHPPRVVEMPCLLWADTGHWSPEVKRNFSTDVPLHGRKAALSPT